MGEARRTLADSLATSTGTHPTRTLPEWERAARELLEEGQNFLAHDVARDGLKQFPDSFKLAIFGAVALSQTGALDEARKLLQPVLDVILIDEGPFHHLHLSLKRAVEVLSDEPGKDTLAVMADLAEAMELVRGKKLVANADTETYTALAGVFREAWIASGARRDLEHCRELFLRAYHSGGGTRAGIDAAVTSWLLGDMDTARDLSRNVTDRVRAAETEFTLSPEERYQLLVTVGEAHLLLGETEEALASFAWASTLEGIHYGNTVSALKQLALLQGGGLSVPPAVFDIIKPPTVVVFTGHPLDRPGEGPHFPPELESAVRAEIAKSLDELGAQVGYSMAACGSDLLFIEAMLERGAEVNVVMPYAMDDFVAENVRYGGSRWEMRFRNALKLATTVTYATEERYLGHGMLYRFANQCLHGMATLRATFLSTAPYLLAVWDMMPGSLVGGAADFIDQWEDIARLRIIDLDGLLQLRPELAGEYVPSMPDLEAEKNEEQGEGRVIRSMMFCDIAGYSKLKEEHTPVFLDFLRIISDGMGKLGIQPIAINTWGDAIFAVMDKASPMAEYAQTLQEMVSEADEHLRERLPHPLSLRISLHAGPVFQATDPICGRQNFYGSHINRAARLEPVTVIGHVYATQQFVAVLTAEQSALRSEAQNRGEEFEEKFACEYVGVLSLAKDFGKQTVYHLRRRVAGLPRDDMDIPEISSEPDVFEPPEVIAAEPDMASPDPAPSEDLGFSDSDMDAMLAEAEELTEAEAEAEAEPEPEPEPPLEPLVFGTVMSDDDITALLDEAEDEESEDPPLLADLGAPISDSDMEAMLAESTELDEGEEDSLPLADLGTVMSDDDIAALLEESEDDDEVPLAELGAPISESDMEAMLAEASDLDQDDASTPEDLSLGTVMSEDDIAALLDEAEDADQDRSGLDDVMLGAPISESDMEAMLAEAVESGEDGEEDGAKTTSPPPMELGTAMSDDDIAALLEEVEDSDGDEQELPVFSGIMSDDDMEALLAEAAPIDDEGEAPEEPPLDRDMAEVAAAVKAAMAKLEAEEAAGAAPLEIHLAPPKPRPGE